MHTPEPIHPPSPSSKHSPKKRFSLNTFLKYQHLPNALQRKVESAFKLKDLKSAQLKGLLDSLPVGNPAKKALWSEYYTFDHPSEPIAELPSVPKTEGLPLVPEAPVDALAQVEKAKPETKKSEDQQIPPKPKELEPEAKPKSQKQFTFSGKQVVGYHGGIAVLEDGSFANVTPTYIQTIKEHGYKELKSSEVERLAEDAAIADVTNGNPEPSGVHYVGAKKDADGKPSFEVYSLDAPDGGKTHFAVKPGSDVLRAVAKKRKEADHPN